MTELSHWGWGRADRFMDRESRLALGGTAAGWLGVAPSEAREPVPLSEVDLPRSRLSSPSSLAFAADHDEARVRRTWGRSYRELLRGFRGNFSAAPDLVLTPSTEEELERALAWADAEEVKIVPYGGGTSVVGGVTVPAAPDRPRLAVLDLTHLSGLIELDPTSGWAHVRAGTRGPALEGELAPHGMTARFYPQSFELATVGGWVATRAGGHFASGPTHIDDLVAGLRTLTPSGWLESWSLPASGAGPSPDRLILGSEGKLGVIASATLRVRPRPARRGKASLRFETFSAALSALRGIMQEGLRPANCRVLDEGEAAFNMVVDDGSAVLLLGFESVQSSVAPALSTAIEIAQSHGGRCPDGPKILGEERAQGAGENWRKAFLDGPYLQTNLVSLGIMADTFETACSWSAFPDLHAAIEKNVGAALAETCGSGHLSCRITHAYPDGLAPYYTFFAVPPEGGEEEAWGVVKGAALDAIRHHRAAATHHHAVGRMHAEAWRAEAPARFQAVLEAARDTLDPNRILAPHL